MKDSYVRALSINHAQESMDGTIYLVCKFNLKLYLCVFLEQTCITRCLLCVMVFSMYYASISIIGFSRFSYAHECTIYIGLVQIKQMFMVHSNDQNAI